MDSTRVTPQPPDNYVWENREVHYGNGKTAYSSCRYR